MRISKSVVLAALIAAAGCSRTGTDQQMKRAAGGVAEPAHQGASTITALFLACPEEANLAVLNKLYPLLGGSGDAETTAVLDRFESRIECIRDWSKTLKDRCIADAYQDWLNFYAGRIAKARDELASNKRETDRQRQDRQERAKEAKIKAYEATHEIPRPPSCERAVIGELK